MKVNEWVTEKERADNDLYCTNPIVVQMLLDNEKFNENVWECCNGLGHISNVLKESGYNVRKSDIVNYTGDEEVEIIDILEYNDKFNGDIITNPPYKLATEIAYKLLNITSGKVALYVNINFLASQRRKALFTLFPPKVIYIISKRYSCAKGGDFTNINGSIDYCWIVWDINYHGNTFVKWI
jgi:hypothetical protein